MSHKLTVKHWEYNRVSKLKSPQYLKEQKLGTTYYNQNGELRINMALKTRMNY